MIDYAHNPLSAAWFVALASMLTALITVDAYVVLAAFATAMLITLVALRRRGSDEEAEARLDALGSVDRFSERLGLSTVPGDEDDEQLPPTSARELANRLTRRLSIVGDAIAKRDRLVRAALDELESVLDAVEEPVIVIDHKRIVRLCNEAAARTLGGEGAPVAGRAIEELFTQEEVLRMVEGARDGSAHRQILRMTRPDATAIYEVSTVPVVRLEEDEWPDVVITLRDVTELAEAAQTKTDFVANASHELRTPLSSIQMAAETLAGELEEAADPPPLAGKLVRVVQVNADRLGELVQDLLDLTRVESQGDSPKPQDIELAPVVEKITALFEPRCAERQVGIKTSLDEGCAVLKTDPRLFELILRNLVDNATKFSRPETSVSVELEPDPSNAGTLLLRVSDKGIGIPLDQQRRIFERFYQVDPARTGSAMRGTGLGLAIVKHACLALGGDVEVESVWQQGTVFSVRLPQTLAGATDG
ncbi:MAG: ATP-binding protein [Planctomycetota bacterium]